MPLSRAQRSTISKAEATLSRLITALTNQNRGRTDQQTARKKTLALALRTEFPDIARAVDLDSESSLRAVLYQLAKSKHPTNDFPLTSSTLPEVLSYCAGSETISFLFDNITQFPAALDLFCRIIEELPTANGAKTFTAMATYVENATLRGVRNSNDYSAIVLLCSVVATFRLTRAISSLTPLLNFGRAVKRFGWKDNDENRSRHIDLRQSIITALIITRHSKASQAVESLRKDLATIEHPLAKKTANVIFETTLNAAELRAMGDYILLDHEAKFKPLKS